MRADGWRRYWPVGEGAVLSHRSAAEHWSLLEGIQPANPRDGAGRRAAARSARDSSIHRSSSLTSRRSRCETASGSPPRPHDRRPAPAGKRGRSSPAPSRQANYKRLDIGSGRRNERARSELERRFLRFCHRNGLPPARSQRADPALHRRLPLAPAEPRRRDRQLERTPRSPSLRGRSRPRRLSAEAWLRGPALYLAPAGNRPTVRAPPPSPLSTRRGDVTFLGGLAGTFRYAEESRQLPVDAAHQVGEHDLLVRGGLLRGGAARRRLRRRARLLALRGL